MTSDAANEVPTGTLLSEYEVVDVLGAGGMGTVYRGVHPIIGKEVAIKVLAPHLSRNELMVERFVREARAVVKIQHRNIIDVFAFGHEPTVGHYFVMPLLAGETIGDRVSREGPLEVEEALHVLDQVAEALEVAHEKGIYHRDLKPDNLYLADERSGPPSVRILDFGIAKLIEGDGSITQTGTQMGTPLFMSPEQWEGADVDHRTDIYALAIVAYHMLTARFPYETNSQIALMNMHVNGEPTLPSAVGLPASFDEVFARALAKDRAYRHQSARELVEALRSAAAGTTASAHPAVATAVASSDTKQRTRVLPWAVGAVAVLGLGVTLALGLRDEEPTAPESHGVQVHQDAGAAPTALAPKRSPHAESGADAAPPKPVSETSRAAEAEAKAEERPHKAKARPKKTSRDSELSNPQTATPEPKVRAAEPPKPKEKTSKWGDTVDPY